MESNPFNPNFGMVPDVFIDRDDMVKAVVKGLAESGSPYRTSLISGVRGVGKTAFLTDVCDELRRDKKWIVADIPSNGNIMETLVQTIEVKASSELKKALNTIEGFSVSVLGVGMSLSTKENHINYQLLLEQMLTKMQERKMHLLVAIDEVVANDEIKLFASIYQIMMRRKLPISLIMTGLPKNISELQNDKVLTFLLRSARIDLPMLSDVNVQYSYKETFEKGGISISQESLKMMTDLTLGYSYAFQLLGYLLWETGSKKISSDVIESVRDKYEANLFRNAYAKIYEESSRIDRAFLKAMAQSDEYPVPVKHVVDALHKAPGYVSRYKTRLIDAGIIKSEAYGYISFALPLFGEYIKKFQM